MSVLTTCLQNLNGVIVHHDFKLLLVCAHDYDMVNIQ